MMTIDPGFTAPAGLVLVVGAGPVGLTVASELARHGVPIRIVDKAPAASTTSKALGIVPRTMETLARMGVVEKFLAAGHRIRGANIYVQGRRLANFDTGEMKTLYPYINIVPQSETEQLLGVHLETFGSRVERSAELADLKQDEGGVTATLRHGEQQEEIVRAAWVVGCDGSHSTVRRLLGLAFEGAGADEAFCLADVNLDWPMSDDHMHGFLSPEGVMAVFPMGGGRFRVIAEITQSTSQAVPPPPTLAEIQALVDARGPKGVVVSDPTWLSAFRIRRRRVRRYRQGRVLLAGDAAHIHSPVGGQGMNTGIQDAFNLAWKLALVVQGASPSELLDTYGEERLPIARSVLRITDMMTRLLVLHQPLAEALRNRAVSTLFGFEAFRQRFASMLGELKINYRDSSIVSEDWGNRLPRLLRAGPAAGERAPDARVHVASTNTSSQLSEATGGRGHVLLLLVGPENKPEDWRMLSDIGAGAERQYGPRLIPYLVATGPAPAGLALHPAVLNDPELAVHDEYAARAACLYVIRPDGYIGYRAMPPSLEGVHAYMAKILA